MVYYVNIPGLDTRPRAGVWSKWPVWRWRSPWCSSPRPAHQSARTGPDNPRWGCCLVLLCHFNKTKSLIGPLSVRHDAGTAGFSLNLTNCQGNKSWCTIFRDPLLCITIIGGVPGHFCCPGAYICNKNSGRRLWGLWKRQGNVTIKGCMMSVRICYN